MPRDDRQHPDKPKGFRTAGQRDRDRLLYCSAFRRLAGVTQVVLPAGEPHLFHNRLVHSAKVAQIAQRLAQRLAKAHSKTELEALPGGGCDSDVVEAASLAHDLGHPPFGHVAEEELDRCVRHEGDSDGFEGNAQTFRIITRLAASSDEWSGLNLSRGTLAAVQKYPWFYGDGPTPKKWGAYRDDHDDFAFARDGMPPNETTLEAQVMDWADDIAYAVHDLEDFYRAGLIPLDRIANGVEDLDPVFDRLGGDKWPAHVGETAPNADELAKASSVVTDFPASLPFRGLRTERADLRAFTSGVVNYLVAETEIKGTKLSPSRGARITSELLKALTRVYVIEGAALQTQQLGQRRIVRTLYSIYSRALHRHEPGLLPGRWREEADLVTQLGTGIPRLVADVIAGMTEQEATGLFQRLTGISSGQFLDPVVG